MGVREGLLLFIFVVVLSRLIPRKGTRQLFVLSVEVVLIVLLYHRSHVPESAVFLLLLLVHYYGLISPGRAFANYALPVALLLGLRFFTELPMIGVSYVTFRMLLASHENHTGGLRRFSLLDYLTYLLYLPTFKLGPIGSFQEHLSSEDKQSELRITDLEWVHLYRVLFGVVKMTYLAALTGKTGEALGIESWETVTGPGRLVLTGVCVYVKVYFGFSGVNDVAIGISHFLGYKMRENFYRPFLARNVSDLWSNWHASLTAIMRDLVFYPLGLLLSRKIGEERSGWYLPGLYFLLFFLVGIWHDTEPNFVFLGLYHAVCAVISVSFGTLAAKVWRGYRKSTVVHVLAVVMTQIYFAVSFLFFDNSMEKVMEVLRRVFE